MTKRIILKGGPWNGQKRVMDGGTSLRVYEAPQVTIIRKPDDPVPPINVGMYRDTDERDHDGLIIYEWAGWDHRNKGQIP